MIIVLFEERVEDQAPIPEDVISGPNKLNHEIQKPKPSSPVALPTRLPWHLRGRDLFLLDFQGGGFLDPCRATDEQRMGQSEFGASNLVSPRSSSRSSD